MQERINKPYRTYLLLKESFSFDNNILLQELISVFENKSELLKTFISLNELNEVDIFELIGIVYQNLKQEELLDSTNYRKHHGIYYTNYSIARILAKDSLKDIDSKDLENIKFYEPCVGGGVFLIAYLDEVISRIENPDSQLFKKIINNIYFSDIDEGAINLSLKIFTLYVKKNYNQKIKINESNYYIGNILFKENVLGSFTKIDPKEIFNIKDGFDIVLTNPPYKLLKASVDKYSSENHLNNSVLLDSIRKSNFYKYNQGTLNLYKIFIEEIVENYLTNKGKAGILIPSGLLKDKQSEKLRKRLLLIYGIERIYIIPERNSFFNDITQSFCFFVLDKNKQTEFIEIFENVENEDSFFKEPIKVFLEDLQAMSETLPIVSVNKIGWEIVNKLNKVKKIKDIDNIFNLRGELDLTLNKKFIVKDTKDNLLPLLKGSHITKFKTRNTNLFCKSDFFLENLSKRKYFLNQRIVCQQISNTSQKDRLKFALVDSNTVLGNSCNFISLVPTNNKSKISLLYLLGILNSDLLNWRFKITNSNNHISNYEIDDLPIKEPSDKELSELEKITLEILKYENSEERIKKLNSIVYKIYKLKKSEIDYINNN